MERSRHSTHSYFSSVLWPPEALAQSAVLPNSGRLALGRMRGDGCTFEDGTKLVRLRLARRAPTAFAIGASLQ